MKLTIVRHAPTSENKKQVFMGQLDTSCSVSCLREFKPLRIADEYIECFCSPLKRAVESFQTLFPTIPYRIEQRIKERDLGIWENKSRSEIQKRTPQYFGEDGGIDFGYTPEGGEPFEVFIGRIYSFILELWEREKDGSFLVVTHNGVAIVLSCLKLRTYCNTISIPGIAHMKPIDFIIDSFDINEIHRFQAKGLVV